MGWADDMFDSAIGEAKKLIAIRDQIAEAEILNEKAKEQLEPQYGAIAQMIKTFPYVALSTYLQMQQENEELKRKLEVAANGN